MKIMFLIRSLGCGGSERQLVTLAKGLHKRGHSVVVAVFYPGGPLEKGLHEAHVPVRVLNKRGRWNVFRFLLGVVRLIHRESVDFLYSYLSAANLLTVLLKPFFPGRTMVWGVRASYIDFQRYDWLTGVAFRLGCWLSRFADLIIVNSKVGIAYHCAHGYPTDKMVMIHNGIDTKYFCPDPQGHRRVRETWGVTENETLIGLVGRLDPMKDHGTFLKAASLALQVCQGLRFVCIGSGPIKYQKELHALGSTLGVGDHVIWADECADMPAVYNALDILTSSSYGEGFPNVLGEAMACGVPCVATEVGDSAWIVGDTGLLVPPKNPEAMAKAWQDLLRLQPETRQSLGRAARTRIETNFAVHTLVSKTEHALMALHSSPGSDRL